jgi:hypothetical protein
MHRLFIAALAVAAAFGIAKADIIDDEVTAMFDRLPTSLQKNLADLPDTSAVVADAWPDQAPPLPPPSGDLPWLEGIVATMGQGQWREIGTPIWPDQCPGPPDIWGNDRVMNCSPVINNFAGAAWDGRCMYFHNGGHRAYAGNEVYSFCFDTGQWTRFTEPDPYYNPDTGELLTRSQAFDPKSPYGCQAPYTQDGTPRPGSIHTAHKLEWRAGSLWRHAGAVWCGAPGHFDPYVWEFNLAAREWINHGEWRSITVDDDPTTTLPRGALILRPDNGNFLLSQKRSFYEFDPETYALQRYPTPYKPSGPHLYDPVRNWHVNLNRNEGIVVWDAVAKTSQLIENLDFVLLGFDSALIAAVYDSTRDLYVFWHGEQGVWTIKPETWETLHYPNTDSIEVPPPSSKTHGYRVYNKWVYVPQLDVFVGYVDGRRGLWAYRLPDTPSPQPPQASNWQQPEPVPEGAILVGPTQAIKTVPEAVKVADAGDVIALEPGLYFDGASIRVPLTILGQPGTHIVAGAVAGKATFVCSADCTLRGIECSKTTVPDRNGACVRIEKNASNVVIANVHFHDNQNGILGGVPGGTIVIKDSLFERNGFGGRAHGVYVSKKTQRFELHNTQMLCAKDQGHGVKSRARETIITGSVIDSQTCDSSRALDVPNGGIVRILNSTIRHGPQAVNRQLIGYGLEVADVIDETTRDKNRPWDTNTLVLNGNEIACEGATCKFLYMKPGVLADVSVGLTGNTITGPVNPGTAIPDEMWR